MSNKYNVPKFALDRWIDRYPVYDGWAYILSEFNKMLNKWDKAYWDGIPDKLRFVKACKAYLRREYLRRLRLYKDVQRGIIK